MTESRKSGSWRKKKIDAVQDNLDAAEERLTATEGEISEAKNVLAEAKALESKARTLERTAKKRASAMRADAQNAEATAADSKKYASDAVDAAQEAGKELLDQFSTSFMELGEPDAMVKEAHAIEDADDELKKLDNIVKPVEKQEAPPTKKVVVKETNPLVKPVLKAGGVADKAVEQEILDEAQAKLKKLALDVTHEGGLDGAEERANEASAKAAAAEVDLRTAEARKATILGEIARFKKELVKVKAETEPRLHLQPKEPMSATLLKKNENRTAARRDAILAKLSKIRGEYIVYAARDQTFSTAVPVEAKKWEEAQRSAAKKKEEFEAALNEKKRSEMETYIRKDSVARVLDVFKHICEHVEDQSLHGPDSKCCRARITCYRAPSMTGGETGGEGEYSRPPVSSSDQKMKNMKIRDDPETMAKMQKELRRLMAQKQEFTAEKRAEMQQGAIDLKEKQQAAKDEAIKDDAIARENQEVLRQKSVEDNEKEMAKMLGDDDDKTGATGSVFSGVENSDVSRDATSFIEKQMLRGLNRNRRK